jgi:hypothetical protein
MWADHTGATAIRYLNTFINPEKRKSKRKRKNHQKCEHNWTIQALLTTCSYTPMWVREGKGNVQKNISNHIDRMEKNYRGNISETYTRNYMNPRQKTTDNKIS